MTKDELFAALSWCSDVDECRELVVAFVAEWLYTIGGESEEPARQIAKLWREEMA